MLSVIMYNENLRNITRTCAILSNLQNAKGHFLVGIFLLYITQVHILTATPHYLIVYWSKILNLVKTYFRKMQLTKKYSRNTGLK